MLIYIRISTCTLVCASSFFLHQYIKNLFSRNFLLENIILYPEKGIVLFLMKMILRGSCFKCLVPNWWTIQEGLENVTLLEEVCHWYGLQGFKTPCEAQNVCLPSACRSNIRSQLLLQHHACHFFFHNCHGLILQNCKQAFS